MHLKMKSISGQPSNSLSEVCQNDEKYVSNKSNTLSQEDS
jgi:hypothetical protein